MAGFKVVLGDVIVEVSLLEARVTILRDTVTTSWSADDICFSYIKHILLVRHLGFVCVLLYIARSGLFHGGSGGIEKTRQ